VAKPANWPDSIPFIDKSVQHTGVSYLRTMNANTLRRISGAVVLQDGDEPLAVLISYKAFMEMQKVTNA